MLRMGSGDKILPRPDLVNPQRTHLNARAASDTPIGPLNVKTGKETLKSGRSSFNSPLLIVHSAIS
jgi:hypothetical protein